MLEEGWSRSGRSTVIASPSRDQEGRWCRPWPHLVSNSAFTRFSPNRIWYTLPIASYKNCQKARFSSIKLAAISISFKLGDNSYCNNGTVLQSKVTLAQSLELSLLCCLNSRNELNSSNASACLLNWLFTFLRYFRKWRLGFSISFLCAIQAHISSSKIHFWAVGRKW